MNTFTELGLSNQALIRLEQIGFKEPTEIQAKTVGILLAGQDIMASAQTGSGKTAAYALPIIERLGAPNKKCRALVLAPTRELALQVRNEFDRFIAPGTLKTALLHGGIGYGKQIREIRRGADIVVATPGRLIDFIEQRMIDLKNVQVLVLDEADRLMDLGFMPQVRNVAKRLPKERQTVMFSATVDHRIEALAQEFLQNPARIAAKQEQIEPASIEQKFHNINEFDKDRLLLELINQAGEGSVLVFTKTRQKASWVANRLRDANVHAQAIHGDINQNQRQRTLEQYRKGDFTVLVATDIAARGLDIPAITHVVNYDLPQSPADYIHRIGRTGRAGRSGCSHTFIAEDDGLMLRRIERLVGRSLGKRTSSKGMPAASPGGRRFKPRSRSAARR